MATDRLDEVIAEMRAHRRDLGEIVRDVLAKLKRDWDDDDLVALWQAFAEHERNVMLFCANECEGLAASAIRELLRPMEYIVDKKA
jgi:hypothetical protein